MAKRRTTTKKQTEDSPKWMEVPGTGSDKSSIFIQRDADFLFIAPENFGRPDVNMMTLLDDGQAAWLHALLGKHLAAKAARQ